MGTVRRLHRRPSLTRRVLGTGAVLVVLVLLAGALLGGTGWQLRQAQRAQDTVDHALRADTDLLRGFVDEETGLRGYLLTGDGRFLAPYRDAQAVLPATTTALRTHVRDLGGPAWLVDGVADAHRRWSTHAQRLIALAGSGQLDAARTWAATERGRQLFDAIRTRNAALVAWLEAADRRQQRAVQVQQRRLFVLLGTSLAALLAVVVTGCLVVWRTLTRPLGRLARAARAVADGDLSAPAWQPAPRVAPEVRSLAADVQAMRDRLTADLHTTREALGALEQSGPAIGALRAALQPFDEHVPGLRVSARLDPAEGLLAGDWYDTVRVGDDRLVVVLGDVAGHGPVSAVFALRLKHSLATALRGGASPGRALEQVSRQLADVPPDLFATVLLVTLDTTAAALTWANAGHPAALLLPQGRRREAVELGATGPLLSPVTSGWSWQEGVHPFTTGDVLLACTDGILEARDGRGREFGADGLAQVVGDAGRAGELADGARLVDAVAAAVVRHSAPLPRRDDQTLVHVLATGRTGRPPAARHASAALDG
ncbi:PP2C family protein-serine/threonine phosphatase [Kineococcus sp. SYSU DK006]|uniref:PP2C family protein-serine/threonine phosphatase n=1 Tax=Kineococcus sp. SYSU DK006 TaxID=3383127 RepID=UPI003D7E3353